MYPIRYDLPSETYAFAGRFYDFFEVYGASSKGIANELAA